MLEVGVGTGVLSLILLKQEKIGRVIATEISPYAIACARVNVQRFGMQDQVDIIQTDLFPTKQAMINSVGTDDGKVDMVLFNPPWLPGDALSWLDQAVYDPGQNLLRRFLSEVQHYVKKEGHVYLILSNLGMQLGLFKEGDLHDMFDSGNLELVEKHDLDNHTDSRDCEVVSLYKLRVKAV